MSLGVAAGVGGLMQPRYEAIIASGMTTSWPFTTSAGSPVARTAIPACRTACLACVLDERIDAEDSVLPATFSKSLVDAARGDGLDGLVTPEGFR